MDELIGIKLVVDGSETIKSIGEVRTLLKNAQDDVSVFSAKFGDTSKEAEKAKAQVNLLQDAISKAFKPLDTKGLIDTFKNIPQLNFAASEEAVKTLLGDSTSLQKAIEILKNNLANVDSEQGFSTVAKVISTLESQLVQLTDTNKNVTSSFQNVSASIENVANKKLDDINVKVNIETPDTANIDKFVSAFTSLPNIDLSQSVDTLKSLYNDTEALSILLLTLKNNLSEVGDTASFNNINTAILTINKRLSELNGTATNIKDNVSLEYLNTELVKAQDELQSASEEFGQFSKEAINASEKVVQLKVNIAELENTSVKSIETLQNELKDSEAYLSSLQNKFVQTGNSVEIATTEVAQLRQQLVEAGNNGDENIGILKQRLKEAEINLKSLNSNFLSTSKALIESKDKVEKLKGEIGNLGKAGKDAFNPELIDKQANSVGSLKTQYRAAVQEVQAIVDKFGLTSIEAAQAASKAAKLRDTIGDANTLIAAFNPDAKFRAFAGSVQGVVSGFTAFQGALGLVGAKSKDVEAALLKVQSALAISQGLQGLFESVDTFKTLGTVIKSTTAFRYADIAATRVAAAVQVAFTGAVETTSVAFKTLKTAIAGTGIGLLVVALGEAITLISDYVSKNKEAKTEEEKLNEEIDRSIEGLDKKREKIKKDSELAVIRAKIAGQTEQQINKIKEDSNKSLVELDRSYLKQQGGFQELLDKVNKNTELSEEEKKNAIKKIKEERNKVIKRVDEQRYDIEKDGLENVKELTLKEREQIKQNAEERAKTDLDFDKEIYKLKIEGQQALIKNSLELEQQKLIDAQIIRETEITQSKASEEKKNELIIALRSKLSNDLEKLNEDTVKRELEGFNQLQTQIDELDLSLKVNADTTALDIATKEVKDKYDKIREQILKQEANTVEAQKLQKKQLKQVDDLQIAEQRKVELQLQQEHLVKVNNLELEYLGIKNKNSQSYRDAEIKAIELDYAKRIELAKQNNEDVVQLEKIRDAKVEQLKLSFAFDQLNKIINDSKQTLDAKRNALDEEQLLTQQQYEKDLAAAGDDAEKKLSIEKQYTEQLKEYSLKRQEFDVIEKETKAKTVGEIADITIGLANVAKTLFEKNKGVQIGALIIEQAASVAKIIANTNAANARAMLDLGPIAGSAFSVVNTISAGISIASTIATVAKSIQQIKSASDKSTSGGGSSSSGIGIKTQATTGQAAPIQPTAPMQATTQLNQQSINQIGSAVFGRSYVLESDISSMQERQRRLNRAARLT